MSRLRINTSVPPSSTAAAAGATGAAGGVAAGAGAGGLAVDNSQWPLGATSPLPVSPIPGGGQDLMMSDDPYAQLADLDFNFMSTPSNTMGMGMGYQTDAPRPQGAGREDLLF